jgi:hypothetical protein
MNTVWGRVLVCIACVALAGAAAAGCTGLSTPDITEPTTSLSSAIPGTPSAAQGTTAAPGSSAGRTVAARVTNAAVTSKAPPPIRACATQDLTIAGADEARSKDGQVGDWDLQVALRNTSRSTCRLQGWPGLEFVGESKVYICSTPAPKGATCGVDPDKTSVRPVTVTSSDSGTPLEMVLAPTHTTTFAVAWSLGYGTCTNTEPMSEPYGVQIRVPGASQPLTLVLGDADLMQICNSVVQVTAFGSLG